MYANDTNISLQSNNPVALQDPMNAEFKNLNSLLEVNKPSFNYCQN